MTNAVHEPARNVPVAHECDVCVVGGSCTGVFAAVRAARLGASVAVVEANGFFGGAATAGLVHVWHSLRDMEGKRDIIGGLTAETLERLGRRNAAEAITPSDPRSAYVLNTEELKIELDELVREHGVRPFLHAWFCAPVVEDGRIAAVVVEDKSGRRAIRARCFIDASGDGDLAARGGFGFEGRDDLQPPTAVAIFDHLAPLTGRPGFSIAAEVHDPRHPEHLKRGFLWGQRVPGRPGAYMVAGTRAHGADCSDADQLTRAEMECRRQVRAMGDILRRQPTDGPKVALANVAASLGIRETRHIRCLHRLTQREVLHGEGFEDAIANGTYCCDVHHSGKAGITMRHLDGRESYSEPGQPKRWARWRDESEGVTPFYQIPYRSLVPEGSRNVLVAGRLIDADRWAYGAVRVMVNCNQTGEAAGVAVALATQRGEDVASLDPALLRGALAEGGSIVIGERPK